MVKEIDTAKFTDFQKDDYMNTCICCNRPFPSSCLPPLQSKSKCKVFVMLISSTLHMNEN